MEQGLSYNFTHLDGFLDLLRENQLLPGEQPAPPSVCQSCPLPTTRLLCVRTGEAPGRLASVPARWSPGWVEHGCRVAGGRQDSHLLVSQALS